MKLRLLIIPILLACFLVVGCSIFGGKTLTNDEQARIVVGGMQTMLPVLKAAGDAYVLAQPQYATQWNTVATPGFISFNQFLKGIEDQGAAGQPISIQTIITQASPQVLSIVNMITAWGAIKPGDSGKATPEQIALIVSVALAQGTLLVNDMQGYLGGNIPTWQMILAQNAAFQNQLTGGQAPIKTIK